MSDEKLWDESPTSRYFQLFGAILNSSKNFGQVKGNGVMSLKLTEVRGRTCHLCIEKVFAKQMSSFDLCVCFKFFPPERIKYLYSEKLLTGSNWCVDFSLIVHFHMSSIQLFGRNMGRLDHWVLHAPKVKIPIGGCCWFQSYKRASILSPNPARDRNIFLKRNLGRMPNLSSKWDMCIACLSTVMIQNIMFLKKKNYHEIIKDGDMVQQNERSRIAI